MSLWQLSMAMFMRKPRFGIGVAEAIGQVQRQTRIQQSSFVAAGGKEEAGSAAGPASDSISFYNLPQTGVPEWLGQSQEKVQLLVTVLRYQLSHDGSLICKAIRSLPSTREWE